MPTFNCECGIEVEQNTRGRKRTKCPECVRKAKKAYLHQYHIDHPRKKPMAEAAE